MVQKAIPNLAEAFSVTIPSGSSQPAAGSNVGGRIVGGVLMPAAWTAAALTFQVSDDDVTYYDLYDTSGAEKSIASPTAGNAYALDWIDFLPWKFIKIRSGTSATPVNQAADRAVQLMLLWHDQD